MPPRYAYWTIIAGGLPTAFRAADREELLPTFQRLRERHPDAQMKWFARGKLWTSPEEARLEHDRRREGGQRDGRPDGRTRGRARADSPPSQARGRDWRPGGEHRDPKQKYRDAKKARNAAARKQRFERREGSPRGREQAGAPERRVEGGWKKDRGRPPARREGRAPKPFAGSSQHRSDRPRDAGRERPAHPPGGSNRPFDRPRSQGAPHAPKPHVKGASRPFDRPQSRGGRDRRDTRDRRDPKAAAGTPTRPFDRAPRQDGGRGGSKPFQGPKRSFDRGGFERGANQGSEEPTSPARPRGPNREPRPSENPPPAPPPRPSEPAIAPPGPPERGRNEHE